MFLVIDLGSDGGDHIPVRVIDLLIWVIELQSVG
jgi:hypothetical protein